MYGYNTKYTLRHPYKVIVKHWTAELRFATQRVRRGWDDRMVWGLDDTLIPMLIEILPKFKDDTGIPCSPDLAPMDGFDYVDEEEARRAWHEVIDTIIEGFKADLVDTYEESEENTAQAEEAWALFVKWRHAMWT